MYLQDSRHRAPRVYRLGNVLIYFNRRLQDRVHHLLHDSLANFGVLGLGARETLLLTPVENLYAELDAPHRLYRRVG
jgi:chemotaxis protein methyltransferase CheR